MEWLWVVLPVGAYFTFLFCAALFEKKFVRSYGAEPLITSSVQLGPYLSKVYRSACASGLADCRFFRHQKYDLTGAFWFTPEKDILVYSGEGKVAKMPAKQTWIYSCLGNGRILVTTDNFDEGDPSGLTEFKRIIDVPLDKLLGAHRKRVENEMALISPFNNTIGPDALAAMAHERVGKLLELGRAQWVDPAQTQWRYTPKGALFVCLGSVTQFLTGLTQFWKFIK